MCRVCMIVGAKERERKEGGEREREGGKRERRGRERERKREGERERERRKEGRERGGGERKREGEREREREREGRREKRGGGEREREGGRREREESERERDRERREGKEGEREREGGGVGGWGKLGRPGQGKCKKAKPEYTLPHTDKSCRSNLFSLLIHSIQTPSQPVLPMALRHQAAGKVITRAPVSR